MGAYEQLGVSPDKPQVTAAIFGEDPGLFPGAFCKIVPDVLTGDPAHCLVMHADGAGTKAIVAYLYEREMGDASVYRGIAQDSLVMNVDDMACVGVTGRFLVSNVVNRNLHRIDGEALRHIIGGYSDFADRMREQGITMTMAGGETADLGDLSATVTVDSTVTARMRRKDVIDARNIRTGNVIVGMASYGQATYEDAENSGIGSNGFTMARHALLSKVYADSYPETYSTTLDRSDVYEGPFLLEHQLPGSEQTVGEALLSPTRTYLPVIKDLLQGGAREAISGIVHSSGGGQGKCLNFGQPSLHIIKDNLLPPPPIFSAIQEASGIDPREMYQVFNMGQRLEVYCDPDAAESVVAAAHHFNIEAQVIGRVAASPAPGKRLTIETGAQTFTYEKA